MIQEEYVSFEIAKLLKEKGFDELCRTYYQDGKFVDDVCTKYYQWNSKSPFEHISAPTIQMVMRWLRKEHKLYIDSFVTYKNDIPHYQWRIDNLKTKDTIVETPSYNEPEEAIESAIQYCLENLI